MKKISILLIYFSIFSSHSIAQSTNAAVLTADSLTSGNVKDVLTSFFQLAFNNLTSAKKELNFNSNPFALILKANPQLAVDSNYFRYRSLRKLNFGFGLKLDSSYRFNGFSSGFKYALINKRDTTTSSLLFTKLDGNELAIERRVLNSSLGEYGDSHFVNDLPGLNLFVTNINNLFIHDTAFNKLDTAFQRVVKNIVKEKKLNYIQRILNQAPDVSFVAASSKIFDSLKNTIKNAPLLTVGISDTTYKDQFFFSNVVFNAEYIKGLSGNKPGSNWEFDFKLNLNFLDDTLKQGRDLKRCIFYTEPGFNWVYRTGANDQSLAELKFSASYLHNFTGLYANEKRDVFMMNTAIRIRIINDIWIPLEIKYDPINGNVFGFLNVRANFTSLGNVLNPKK